MENFVYLGKVSLLISICWLIYHFLLQNESFKHFNRWFLIAGIGISFLLPLVTLTKVVEIPMVEQIQFQEVITSKHSFGGNIEEELRTNLDPFNLFFFIYLLGVSLMCLKLIIQLISLRRLASKCRTEKIEGITHYLAPIPIASFSFFKGIFYHKNSHDDESLHMIITHEKVHINDLHSIDLILGNLLQLTLWFLPFAYFYRKSIIENLEFLADKKTLDQLQDKKQYQYTLLHSVQAQSPQFIGNFFFSYSSLKKRIMNMNQKQSAPSHRLKSLVLLPVLSLFVFLFQTETIAKQVPQQNAKITSVAYEQQNKIPKDSTLAVASFTTKMETSINKTTSDEEISQLVSSFKEIMDVDIKISALKRNKKGEITKIHIKVEDKEANLVSEQKVESTNGIDPIIVYRKKGKENDILAVASEAIIRKKEGVKNKNTSSALTAVLKDKEEVYFNGKKLDITKKNVFTTYKIEKETEKSLYLKGTFIEALDNLKEVMKLVNQEPTFYIISKSEFNQDQKISVMHVSSNSFITSNEINAYQKVSDVKVETHGNVGNFYDVPTPLSTSPIKQGNLVYLVNGKIIDDELLKEISPQSIERVEVLKNKEEIQKHTKKEVDGVVKITLKEIAAKPPKIEVFDIELEDEEEDENIDDFLLDGNKVEFKADEMEIENVKIYAASTFDFSKNEAHLFYMNGKKMKDKDVDNLLEKGGEFKRVIVITNKEEIKKYTKKNIDQIILLETK